jgi:ABC-type lipoprotein release transport system permease subunit
MPKLNKPQLMLLFFITGIFMGQFTPLAGVIIAITMIILGRKEVFSLNN